jgi:hypothetical protein
MAFAISEFKSQLTGGGARGSLFQVQITNPIDTAADSILPFMCYSAGIPESQVNPFELYYFGRQIKYAGNRIFGDWTVEIYNDENFAVRHTIEEWMNAINTHVGNLRTYPTDYKSQAQVNQLAQDGSTLRTYTFEGMFPVAISPIQLSWEMDGIERFNVTFQYDLWRVSGGSTGTSTS